MAKKFNIKNVSMVFLPFVPAHIEYFKDGRPILAKLKNGSWDIIYRIVPRKIPCFSRATGFTGIT